MIINRKGLILIMKNIVFSISSLSIFGNLKKDKLIIGLKEIAQTKDINEAVAAYSGLIALLSNHGGSLSDYIYNRAIHDDNIYMRHYANPKGKIDAHIEDAVQHDIKSLSHIATITSDIIKANIGERFPNYSAQIEGLPGFYAGEWSHTAESFRDFARENGFGIFAKHHAFIYEDMGLVPVKNPDKIRLTDLKKYDVQRKKVVENTLGLLAGKPANNVLLYGDRGTGKSSTVKALGNEYADKGLRIVGIAKENLSELGRLIELLEDTGLKFIVFIDDLTFNEDDDSFGALKAVLEGSLVPLPPNMAIYATTNRRHLIKETFTAREGNEIHRADTIDESLSLSDRFGLMVTFLLPAKDEFLQIVSAIAQDRNIDIDKEKLWDGAERFALMKSGRTPRLAKQYIDYVQSRLELGLDI